MAKGAIGKAFRDIDKAIKKATVRSLNRALTSTSAKMAKDVKSDTGVKAALIKKRFFEKKAKTSTAVLSVGTKVGLSLGEFAPKEKKVKVAGKARKGQRGRPKSRTYTGVTVKIGNQPRQLVPGGFLWTANKSMKDLVLARKGSLDSNGNYVNKKAPAYPTVAMRTQVIADSAKARQSEAQEHMVDMFDKNIGREIKFALSKK